MKVIFLGKDGCSYPFRLHHDDDAALVANTFALDTLHVLFIRSADPLWSLYPAHQFAQR